MLFQPVIRGIKRYTTADAADEVSIRKIVFDVRVLNIVFLLINCNFTRYWQYGKQDRIIILNRVFLFNPVLYLFPEFRYQYP